MLHWVAKGSPVRDVYTKAMVPLVRGRRCQGGVHQGCSTLGVKGRLCQGCLHQGRGTLGKGLPMPGIPTYDVVLGKLV